MYIFEYSLIIMVNDVKLTVPWWRKGQRIWSGRIGNLYIHYIAKSIGSPLLMKGLTTLVISMSTNLNV